MLSRFLRHLLFNLVHLVLTILVAIKNVHRRFVTKQSNFSMDEVSKSDIKLILENAPHLRKKLHHLVLLSDTDHHSLSVLALIVIWSLLAGVPYVSFYDVTGELSEQEDKLFLEVERRKKGIPGCIKWSKMPDLNGYTNGVKAHTVTINILRHEDGRPRIADCIKRIATSDVPCETADDLSAQDFNKSLTLVYPPIPEPDLVFYTGPLCCTNGLLPWHIRLTEFVQLSVDSSINVESYLDALSKYNKCDQRFGK